MNYLKMNNLNSNCFKDTNIQISQNINTNNLNSDFISNSNHYFTELSKKENIIDLFSPLILNYPNSDLSLFLAVILNQHIIEISPSLNSSSNLFKKYQKDLIDLYKNVLPKQKNTKLLENICASITALIMIGFQGQWCNGIDQLISLAKENNGNNEFNLIAALILSNTENIYDKLEQKIDRYKIFKLYIIIIQ